MSSEHKSEYVSAVPVEVSWKLLKKGNDLLPKLLPAIFAKIEILEGDGGAGTVRVVTLGEGVGPEAAGQKVKERVEVLDDATHTLSYSILEGGDPRYQGLRFTLKLSPAGDAGSTAIDWTVNYTPVNDAVPPPKHLEAIAEASVKAIEGYAKEHAAELA